MEQKNARALLKHKRTFRSLLPLRDWTSTASAAHWLYLVGSLFFILTLWTLIIALLVAPFSDTDVLGRALLLLWPVVICWVSGFVWEVSKVIQACWRYPVVKWALRLLIAVAGIAATCVARYIINFITIGLDPSFFPRATAIIAIPSAIVIWWTAALFLSFSLFLFSFLIPGVLTVQDKRQVLHRHIHNNFIYRFFFNKPKVHYRPRRKTSSNFGKYALWICHRSVVAGRTVSVGVLFFGLWYSPLALLGGVPSERVFHMLTETIVKTEYYRYSRCSNHRPDEVVAYIGGDNISVARPDPTIGYVFDVWPCGELLPYPFANQPNVQN